MEFPLIPFASSCITALWPLLSPELLPPSFSLQLILISFPGLCNEESLISVLHGLHLAESQGCFPVLISASWKNWTRFSVPSFQKLRIYSRTRDLFATLQSISHNLCKYNIDMPLSCLKYLQASPHTVKASGFLTITRQAPHHLSLSAPHLISNDPLCTHSAPDTLAFFLWLQNMDSVPGGQGREEFFTYALH